MQWWGGDSLRGAPPLWTPAPTSAPEASAKPCWGIALSGRPCLARDLNAVTTSRSSLSSRFCPSCQHSGVHVPIERVRRIPAHLSLSNGPSNGVWTNHERLPPYRVVNQTKRCSGGQLVRHRHAPTNATHHLCDAHRMSCTGGLPVPARARAPVRCGRRALIELASRCHLGGDVGRSRRAHPTRPPEPRATAQASGNLCTGASVELLALERVRIDSLPTSHERLSRRLHLELKHGTLVPVTPDPQLQARAPSLAATTAFPLLRPGAVPPTPPVRGIATPEDGSQPLDLHSNKRVRLSAPDESSALAPALGWQGSALDSLDNPSGWEEALLLGTSGSGEPWEMEGEASTSAEASISPSPSPPAAVLHVTRRPNGMHLYPVVYLGFALPAVLILASPIWQQHGAAMLAPAAAELATTALVGAGIIVSFAAAATATPFSGTKFLLVLAVNLTNVALALFPGLLFPATSRYTSTERGGRIIWGLPLDPTRYHGDHAHLIHLGNGAVCWVTALFALLMDPSDYFLKAPAWFGRASTCWMVSLRVGAFALRTCSQLFTLAQLVQAAARTSAIAPGVLWHEGLLAALACLFLLHIVEIMSELPSRKGVTWDMCLTHGVRATSLAYAMTCVDYIFGLEDTITFATATATCATLFVANSPCGFAKTDRRARFHDGAWRLINMIQSDLTGARVPIKLAYPTHAEVWNWRAMRYQRTHLV